MEEKTCGNCKYFNRYYTKRKISISATACGRCFHKRIKSKTSTVYEGAEACEKWEPTESDDTMQNIEEYLKQTAKYIEDIALILNERK